MMNWAAPAKLNLFLYITGQREDGYHNLQTLFQLLDYGDELTFSPRQDNQIQLTTFFENVAQEDNLIYIAATRLRDYAITHKLMLPQPFGIDIAINKKLPMGGGLGGGSSNAATVFVALNQLWQLNLTKTELMKLGLTLGADVPIFIFGHSAFAQGVGDKLQSVDVDEKWYLVIKPNISIATASIFKHPQLKRDSVTKNITQLLNEPFSNDCQPIVCQLYPEIDQLIQFMSQKASTRLTGTGACIFSECTSKQQAEILQLDLLHHPLSTLITTSFIAKGVNQSPLLT